MDDSTDGAVLAALHADVTALLRWVAATSEADLAASEQRVREETRQLGARLREAGLTARGTGHAGPRLPGQCGGAARFAGYRPKAVQTLGGWVSLRRAY